MKSILLCNSPMAIPSLHALVQNGLLAGLCVPESEHSANVHARAVAQGAGVDLLVLEPDGAGEALGSWIESIDPDVLFCMGFPHRIPEAVLEGIAHGGWNFHPSPLPRYRGPDPLYWQLRNGETKGAMTVHRIEGGMDAGPIAVQIEVPIDGNDCYGTLLGRMSMVAGDALGHLVQNLEGIATEPQVEESATSQKRPTPDDWVVDWAGMSAREIHDLVRATNPQYGGALAFLQGTELRILEAEPVEAGSRARPDEGRGTEADAGAKIDAAADAEAGPEADAKADAAPGSIIAASEAEGLRVSCREGHLSIRIAYLEQGVFTGRRLVALFDLEAGSSFETPGS